MRTEVIGGDVLLRDFERIAQFDTAPLMASLGRAVVNGILRRTAQGLDEEDRPFKPIKNTRSTPLWDFGWMLGAMDVLSSGKADALIGFRTLKESDKAIWQHYGTRGPYPIRPKKPGGALAFASGGGAGSFSNMVRIGSRNSELGQQFYKIGQSPKTSRVTTGMTVVAGVMHPGLSPRPFFGISPKLQEELDGIMDRWATAHLEGKAA